MPDTTTSVTPTPTPPKPRAARGFIDQQLEDDMNLAEDCQLEAVKLDVATALLPREWASADQDLLTASLGRCDGWVLKIKELRTGKVTRTKEEKDARTEVIFALDPILKGARRSYADGSAERQAYGIGTDAGKASTKALLDLVAYGFDQLGVAADAAPGTLPKDKLRGVLPSEIAALDTLHQKYKDADWAQGDAEQQAAFALAQLRKEIETILNPLRRDLQGAADQAYTHRDPLNAPQRKAFGLQPDKPLND